jgi:hypothetical protein
MLLNIALRLILAFMLALPVGNAICYMIAEQDLPDEHDESLLSALSEPLWLLMFGDNLYVYRVTLE